MSRGCVYLYDADERLRGNNRYNVAIFNPTTDLPPAQRAENEDSQ